MLFADAKSDYKDALYVICGVPFDGTSCCRLGSAQAPLEIRKASHYFETYNPLFDIDLKDVRIHDAGDLVVERNIDETLSIISAHADEYVKDKKIPLMLGGEHSLTLPFALACRKKYPDLGFLVLDAHLDLREEYRSSQNSHACISRRILEGVTKKYVAIGIRSGAREEYEYVEENKIKPKFDIKTK